MFWKVWPKGCQRCGGDLSLDSDLLGDYIACLQCSAAHYETEKSVFALTVARKEEALDGQQVAA